MSRVNQWGHWWVGVCLSLPTSLTLDGCKFSLRNYRLIARSRLRSPYSCRFYDTALSLMQLQATYTTSKVRTEAQNWGEVKREGNPWGWMIARWDDVKAQAIACLRYCVAGPAQPLSSSPDDYPSHLSPLLHHYRGIVWSLVILRDDPSCCVRKIKNRNRSRWGTNSLLTSISVWHVGGFFLSNFSSLMKGRAEYAPKPKNF